MRAENTVRFVLDGEIVELHDVDPTRTVLQVLREDLRRTGTKEGCAEGDCGACTVVVADIDASGKRLRVRAVNACIQFLPTLDGKELITVESLQGDGGLLHPVQQAMLDCHGSQCGFCTPGFVMSLFALFKNNNAPGRREIDDALAGNLCRCTGYQPIVNAAGAMYGQKSDGGWLATPGSGGRHVSAEEKNRIALLRGLRRSKALAIEHNGRRHYAPLSLSEFAACYREHPEAIILAGGTDVALWVTKQHRELETIIYAGAVPELTTVESGDSYLDIGAAVTLSDAAPAITAQYPEFGELFLRFASPPIRNAGTLGGNIANGSPIGDSMPALLALDAQLLLRAGKATRQLPLNEFYLAYQHTALQAGEFVERILIPLRDALCQVQSYKVSKRFDQDISAVCGAFFLRLDDDKVATVRIAYGGLAAVPKRAFACEKTLCGQQWNEHNIEQAMAALAQDFSPISDMRASAQYRQKLCRNLLQRFYLETSGGDTSRVYAYGR